jgi:hypothetical protein
MKMWIGFVALATAMCCWAQEPDEAKLKVAMKLAGSTHGAMGKKIAAKDASAAEDATKLMAAFKMDTMKFFEATKAEDGIGFAKTAITEYAAISKAVEAGNWEDAAASHKKASATCMGCHTAHREKLADGSYKAK